MLKILGSLCIIISGTLSGQKICEHFKDRIHFLEDFKDFVFFTKNEVEYKRSEPIEILHKFNSKSALGKLLKKCISLIQNGENFPGAWEKTFNSCKFDINNIILNFGKEFGSHNLSSEIELCNLSINNIDSHIRKLKKDISDQEKMFIVVGTCVGIIVSILII